MLDGPAAREQTGSFTSHMPDLQESRFPPRVPQCEGSIKPPGDSDTSKLGSTEVEYDKNKTFASTVNTL